MELKKVSNFDSLIQPEKSTKTNLGEQAGGISFRDTLKSLEMEMKPTAQAKMPEAVKFSNHAVERMQTRGISFNQNDLGRLTEAVNKAAAKGSKDTLVLMNDSALIVSVKNKTVVTVMDKTALKENVFTNIDSTIVM